MRKGMFLLCCMLLAGRLFAESNGERLFKENRPAEAVLFLEDEIAGGTASPAAYNYLGLAYYQLGQYQKSADAFAVGLKVPGTNKKILAFNQGNAYFALKDFESAAKSFSLAVTMDANFSDAVLNRGNSYLMAGNYQEAINDYKKFQLLNPGSLQEDVLADVIGKLETEVERQEEERRLAEAEAARIAEEERLLQEELERQRLEAERIAEEKRLAEEKAERERLEAEAERRRKILEEVANSLNSADSTNMSSGAEDLIDYNQESELD